MVLDFLYEHQSKKLSDETAGAHCGRDATLRDDEGSQAEVTLDYEDDDDEDDDDDVDYEDDVMMLMMMVVMIKDPRLR